MITFNNNENITIVSITVIEYLYTIVNFTRVTLVYTRLIFQIINQKMRFDIETSEQNRNSL